MILHGCRQKLNPSNASRVTAGIIIEASRDRRIPHSSKGADRIILLSLSSLRGSASLSVLIYENVIYMQILFPRTLAARMIGRDRTLRCGCDPCHCTTMPRPEMAVSLFVFPLWRGTTAQICRIYYQPVLEAKSAEEMDTIGADDCDPRASRVDPHQIYMRF